MMRYALVLLALSACPKKNDTGTQGQGSTQGSATTDGIAAECTATRPHVEQLYRALAQQAEPKRVDEAVADNTRMVMLDCNANPTTVSACVRAAKTVEDIETKCLARLDEAGNPT